MDEDLNGGLMIGSCEMKTGWSLNKLNTLVVLWHDQRRAKTGKAETGRKTRKDVR